MSTSHRMTPQKVSKEQKKKQKKQVMEEETDFLDVDRPIPGQSFVCMSFLSPEAAIKERYLWYLKEFLNDLVAPIPQPEDMPDLEYKTKLHSILMSRFSDKGVANIWEDFLYNKKEELDAKYNEEVDFQTSTRGLKIRGTYSNYAEAKRRSNTIAKFDKNHHVYIGQVGYWLPWDPDPHELENQEYQEKELNTLMKKYRENLMCKDQFFEERNREKMEAALKKNKDAKRVSKEDEKELAKVRKTVSEKDKLLNAALEAKRKKKREEKVHEVTEVSQPAPETVLGTSQVTADTVSSVFDTQDPWLQRKLEGKQTFPDEDHISNSANNSANNSEDELPEPTDK